MPASRPLRNSSQPASASDESSFVRPGDRLSISYPGGRTFFAEFANGGGNGVALALTAWLPVSVPVGASVNLDAPRIRVRIPPDGFIPFLDLPGGLSVGGALTLVQKL